MFSKKAMNALKVLVDVAIFEHLGPVSRKNISQRQDLPKPELDRLLTQLLKAQLLKSLRGREGGYHLAKEASLITAFDFVEAVEGPEGISSLIDLGANRKNGPAPKVADQVVSLFQRSIKKALREMRLNQFVSFAESRGLVGGGSTSEN